MKFPRIRCLPLALTLCMGVVTKGREPSVGNSFAYLDSHDVYYPSGDFPELTTPSWFGEPDVRAVVILSIDDMRDPEKYEAFLRPVLNRLRDIEGGRSPLSIMSNEVDPNLPRLGQWLREGLSIETHTRTHPCPLLANEDLERAAADYLACIEQMSQIPHNHPVAFRMPCCDSMNSVSPRFFSEIFNRRTAAGRFLTIDSSVFMLLTPNNESRASREWVTDESGESRFSRYVQFTNFVNYIEDYPYPYVIANRIWELPCIVPSDWEGQHVNGRNSPRTLDDLTNALAAVVDRKGVFTLVFHPHGWIRTDQVVELIDFAFREYGRSVRFASFRDVQQRIDEHLLDGWPLKSPEGRDHGVRLLDLNSDGHLDIVIGHPSRRQTRVWAGAKWVVTDFPFEIVDDHGRDQGVRFVNVRSNRQASVFVRNEDQSGLAHFDGMKWKVARSGQGALEAPWDKSLYTTHQGRDRGVRGRDVNGDGFTDLIVNNESDNVVLCWDAARDKWRRAPFRLPAVNAIVDEGGRDRGLRFIDLNRDRLLDVVCSNEDGYFVRLFVDANSGWSRVVFEGRADDKEALPLIVRDGRENGVWFRNGALYVQNEWTGHKPGQSIRRDLMPAGGPPLTSP